MDSICFRITTRSETTASCTTTVFELSGSSVLFSLKWFIYITTHNSNVLLSPVLEDSCSFHESLVKEQFSLRWHDFSLWFLLTRLFSQHSVIELFFFFNFQLHNAVIYAFSEWFQASDLNFHLFIVYWSLSPASCVYQANALQWEGFRSQTDGLQKNYTDQISLWKHAWHQENINTSFSVTIDVLYGNLSV